jgi:hypothetical protein
MNTLVTKPTPAQSNVSMSTREHAIASTASAIVASCLTKASAWADWPGSLLRKLLRDAPPSVGTKLRGLVASCETDRVADFHPNLRSSSEFPSRLETCFWAASAAGLTVLFLCVLLMP